MENSNGIPDWLQWIGLIVTIVSGFISALVLWQTSQLKNAFFLKAKLPNLHKKIGGYRLEFNEILASSNQDYKQMRVIQAKVTSILKQAKPSLGKIDKIEVTNAINVLTKQITNESTAWSFYEKLSALETHIGESLEDLHWNN